MSILVGFEIETGRRIEVPAEGHLAWFGQTQLSGKTTALEALVYRGKFKALAFITKQGEGSFLTGRQIQPYFSEPANDPEQPLWRWVKSILEASQARRLNFEESWIIRACEDPKQAKSLSDVHANIKALLAGEGKNVQKGKKKQEWKWTRKPVSGMNAGVYTSLKAYFDIVMPQLARLPYVTRLDLQTGLSVMDLREYAMETQALVIRSCLEWVYRKEHNTRVIVPEAQDFVPQGKNSPVKMACGTLVRKAGANKNFMWLDSQDMAAVDKEMLRACSIIGCGVQTEMHEIDRTLASMFSPALKPVDIAKLKLGEFFVRIPEAKVAKVYVMPAWMDSEVHAQAIAKGEVSVETTRLMLRKFADDHKPAPAVERVEIQEKNDARRQIRQDLSIAPNREGLARCAENQGSAHSECDSDGRETEETMWEEKYKALEKEHKKLIETHDALAKEVGRLRKIVEAREMASGRIQDIFLKIDQLLDERARGNPNANEAIWQFANDFRNKGGDFHPDVKPPAAGNGSDPKYTPPDFEALYVAIRERAKADPGILQLLQVNPEIHVKIERPIVSFHGNQVDGQICKLIVDHFLETPRDRGAIGAELVRRGALKKGTNLKILSPALHKLSHLGFLTVEAAGYQAVPGMKIEVRQ